MYEMEGPSRPCRASTASCPAFPALAGYRQCQTPARGTGFPVSRPFPESPPGGARFRR